jgi:hypothetical protein
MRSSLLAAALAVVAASAPVLGAPQPVAQEQHVEEKRQILS